MAQSQEPQTPPPPKPSRGLMGRIVPRSPTEAIQPVAAPPPPPVERRRRPVINFISGFLSLVMVLALVAGGGLFVGKVQYFAPGPLGRDKVVTVKGGTTDVAEQLQREGVIEHYYLFLAGLHMLGKASQIKAGEYQFKEKASLNDVVETLVEGKAILHAVTIPEGLTSQQIVDRLRENDVLVGEVGEIPKEGSLLPETYKFTRGMTRAQLIERMQQDQARVMREVWNRRQADLPVKTPQEMLVLASIVEKETGKADERSRVAGVFINRLNRNMKLQSDPTIVYGLVGGKGTLGRGILRSEIDQATPYNTYVIPGLPPGPISNPGRAALEAVANPSRTRELYFVADGTGGHVFADTLEQHNRNVVRWRQIEGDRRDAAPVDLPATAPPSPARALAEDPPPATTPGAPLAPSIAPGQPGGKRSPQTQAPAPQQGQQPGLRQGLGPLSGNRGNLDAVAGTPKDPLANKTFDLNSPKTVPALPR
ncbi:endolytic transglycosylase MltG [uncultured Alsobacter sp.]|uniref:endolytic transglycosylase MltG n=1 Tax=uncultured Alsobacter sp. TaxID=1748258 RepID=UPI0025FE3FC4|nr:endolytic transglycosylase MltG [uncultured Alsobacter sp.]